MLDLSRGVFDRHIIVLQPSATRPLFLTNLHFYPSQTKILEGLTKDEMRIFEALFKGVLSSCEFGRHIDMPSQDDRMSMCLDGFIIYIAMLYIATPIIHDSATHTHL
jgi:hypothetical protein